jgi:penicillin-binding protein 1A
VRIGNRGPAGGLWWRIPAALAVWIVVATPQLAAIVAYKLYAKYAAGLPAVPDLDEYARAAPRSSRILAADGTVLAEIPFVVGKEAGHRFWVPYAELPPRLIEALLAAEDLRFFEHGGVDPRAIVRAALANWRAGHTVEGASTITQQVARNLLPVEIGRERSFRRKAREMILARRIERSYTKQQILETYANHVFLGSGAYGVAAAARAYFAKPLGDLTLAETAMIAGMAQAPGRTDPWQNPDAAKARRDEVLARMLRAHMIDRADHDLAAAAPLGLRAPIDPYGTIAPWITEQARQEIAEIAPEDFARGGLDVWTTALPAAAVQAEQAARAGSNALAARHADQHEAPPQVGVYAFDRVTGYVEATVGGLSWSASKFDRATQACRQPGSAFKPIVYVAALEHDTITPGTPLRDAPVSEYDEDHDVFWKPRNEGKAFRGVVLAQDALAASLNAPAVDVIDRVGPARAVAMAERLGITTKLDPVRPIVLGSSCVIPAELARAFGVFASGGHLPQPIVITHVMMRGEPVLDRGSGYDPFASEDVRLDRLVAGIGGDGDAPVLDTRTSFLITTMLAEVTRSGTAYEAHTLGRPCAGKTGTTNDDSDAWFVGFTGRVVAAVWVGHDDQSHKLGGREEGAHAALPIWMDTIRALEGDRPAVAVPPAPPDGVVQARVDRATGLLAASGAGGAEDLWFRAGTAPTETVNGVRDVPRSLDRVARDF